jgi:hypothetical protein
MTCVVSGKGRCRHEGEEDRFRVYEVGTHMWITKKVSEVSGTELTQLGAWRTLESIGI